MRRPKIIKDENWRWLDESHPVNDYVKDLHKYIDYLEGKKDSVLSPMMCSHQSIVMVVETPELRSEHEQLIGLEKTWVECEDCKIQLPIDRITIDNRKAPFIDYDI